jgi:uncharacterized protein (DUF2225 family)
MPGMDSTELSRRDGEVSKGLHSLLDDMYAAIDDKAPLEARAALIEKGTAKLAQHDQFLADLQGIQREQTEKKYQSFIEELKKFLQQLSEAS